MAKNNLQDLVERVYNSSKYDRAGSGLGKVKSNIDRQAALRSMRWSVWLMGFGFGFLTIAFENSWVTHSPLFIVAGSITCLLFVALCWVTGILWWVVTGSRIVSAWAENLWPFCTQPYRSGAGIVMVFVIIALFCPLLLRICNRLPWIGRHLQASLVWLRWLLWLLTIGVWVAAIWLNKAEFLKDVGV